MNQEDLKRVKMKVGLRSSAVITLQVREGTNITF